MYPVVYFSPANRDRNAMDSVYFSLANSDRNAMDSVYFSLANTDRNVLSLSNLYLFFMTVSTCNE